MRCLSGDATFECIFLESILRGSTREFQQIVGKYETVCEREREREREKEKEGRGRESETRDIFHSFPSYSSFQTSSVDEELLSESIVTAKQLFSQLSEHIQSLYEKSSPRDRIHGYLAELNEFVSTHVGEKGTDPFSVKTRGKKE
jgi:hypothetical protein